MTTVNYFTIPPTEPLPVLSSRPAVTCLNDFDTSDLFWLWLVIEHCYRSQNIDDCREIFQRHLPQHAIALTRMLIDDLEDGLLHVNNPWVAPSLLDLDELPQFPRNALPLTRSKFAAAKSLLKEILRTNDKATYALNALLHSNPTSQLHIAIIYACFDLSLPFPHALNRRLLWCFIADILQYRKTSDLTLWTTDALPPIPSDTNKEYLAYELNPDENSDPFSLLCQLYTILHPATKHTHVRPSSALPWFDIFIGVDKTGCGTGGTWHILGRRQSFMIHRRDCLPTDNESLPELGRREVRAVLDAATCWAHMWAGHAVRFHVHSSELRARMNDWGNTSIPPSENWPEVNLLASLAHRWNFTYEALEAFPADNRVNEASACAVYGNIAYENSARCVQVVDSLLMDIFAERLNENPPDAWFLGFVHLHLELEGRMLSKGQTPGGMYYAMRDAQKAALNDPARESTVDREMTEPLEDDNGQADAQSFAREQEQQMRALCCKVFEYDRLVRDASITVRARAMDDAENDAETAIGAVLTFEPYVNCMTDDYQNWLKVLWQYENEQGQAAYMSANERKRVIKMLTEELKRKKEERWADFEARLRRGEKFVRRTVW